MEESKRIDSLREVCKEIGCSGMSSECLEKPHLCTIIRKLCKEKE